MDLNLNATPAGRLLAIAGLTLIVIAGAQAAGPASGASAPAGTTVATVPGMPPVPDARNL